LQNKRLRQTGRGGSGARGRNCVRPAFFRFEHFAVSLQWFALLGAELIKITKNFLGFNFVIK
jgi:hypothetical protein